MSAPQKILPEHIHARRERALAALSRQLGDGLLLIGAGRPIPVPGGHDRVHPYRPHPEYHWLTGAARQGGVLALDGATGQWTHFVEPATAAERLWEGEPEVPEDGRPLPELEAWLGQRRGRAAALLGVPWPALRADEALTAMAQEALDAARRPKDAWELDVMRRAIEATAQGHAVARQFLRPGVTERAVQIELEAQCARAGADGMGYDTIIAAGARAAILHAPASPRVIQPEDLVLIDAGAHIGGYTADVTRTWPAQGQLQGRRLAMHQLVEAALDAAIAAACPGQEWHEVHRVAAVTLADGLRQLGLLRGADARELAESGAVAMFFPHGVGHMLGLGVRDVGGRAPGRAPGRTCCGVSVRVDLPLEPGMIMTVEPGLYLVDALLDDPERRARQGDLIDWQALDAWRGLGGVRLEDDILIQPQGPPLNLTAAIPRR